MAQKVERNRMKMEIMKYYKYILRPKLKVYLQLSLLLETLGYT